jgi:sigma-B regulation protein RsbU (phosphoserine phosphatase)
MKNSFAKFLRIFSHSLRSRLITFLTLFLLLLSTGYYVYTLSVQGAFFRSSYAQNTSDVMDAIKFGIELSLEEENYTALQKIFSWAKGEHYVKFIVLLSEDSSVIAQFPEDYKMDRTSLSQPPSFFSDDYILKSTFSSSITKGTLLVGFSTQSLRLHERKILIDVGISTLIFILLSVLFGSLFSKGITKPLEELKRVTEKISSGNIDERVTLKKGTDEVLSVSSSFNTMVDRVLAAQKDLENDLLEAAAFVKTTLPLPTDKPFPIDWKFLPSKRLGGDSFGYEFIDEETFAFYLLDVSGHGLGAALLSVAVLNVLRSKSLKDADFKNPSSVLYALNNAFPMEHYGDKYFTIWYGVLNIHTLQLSYSCAGHPPALLIRKSELSDAVVHRIGNKNFFIGGMPGFEFDTDIVELRSGDTLFLLSDGVYELEKIDGSIMSLDEFEKFILRFHSESFTLDSLIFELSKIKMNAPFDDDFSIIKITL